MLKAGLTIKNDSGRVYDRFRHRIMFPIRDVRGVIGCGRKIGDEEGLSISIHQRPRCLPKTRNSTAYTSARLCSSRLLVAEGYMDVVALAQRGFQCGGTPVPATGVAHHRLSHTDEVVWL